MDAVGESTMRVSASQIAFSRRVAFAWAWVPGRYLGNGHAPLVLSFALRHRLESPRIKETVEPSAGRFMHHLEVRDTDAIDDEVREWLSEAWLEAR